MSAIQEMMRSLKWNKNQLSENAFKGRIPSAPNRKLKSKEFSAQVVYDTKQRMRTQRKRNLRIKLAVFSALVLILLLGLYLVNTRVLM